MRSPVRSSDSLGAPEELSVVEIQPAARPEAVPAIAGYQIHEKIGEGGMGQVYRATQLSLARTVAIKWLRPLPSGEGPSPAFARESRVMGSLGHPHVVAIHDCGQMAGRQYLVMEYVPGASLRASMAPGKPWPVRRALPVLEAIAQALDYIDQQGILHLDLKPENVLCGEHGAIKITDFGLALPRVDARTLSDLGLAQGSIDYCSPEQRHGLPLDQRSDVFSLATVAYELLTGRLPSRVYVPASRRNRRLSAAADEVLRRGLARDALERYGSAQEFYQALAGTAQRHPLGMAPAGALAATAILAMAAGLLMAWIALANNHHSRAPEGGGAVGPATLPAHAKKGLAVQAEDR
jgi:eukaryotic-like serine/threonine-protein kinase